MNDLWKRNERAILASIVRVQGSAYRREGARMLFWADGGQTGTLSAGCLESDLAYRAEALLTDGTTAIQVYDTSSQDDFTWGRGSGCNGVITVLLETVPGSQDQVSMHYWSTVLGLYSDGKPMHTLRRINQSNGETLGFLVDVGDDNHIGSLGDPSTDANWLKKMSDLALTGEPCTCLLEGGDLLVFERLQPKDRLFIFGAGPDAEPMVDVLGRIGFDVTLVDHRPVRLKPELFPHARLIDSHPDQAAEKVGVPDGSYAIVMTHSFQSDRVWVEYLVSKNLCYLGVLGPKLRTLRLFPMDAIPEFVKSPIGLDIGADGPEEIALSVAAELIQVRRQKRTGPAVNTTACFPTEV